MERMSPATKLLLGSLRGKYNHFAKKGMLAGDGSFYCSDEALMWELGLCDNTIQRARTFLRDSGEINYILGERKGVVTRYWILPKGLKWEPFGKKREGPKISAEGPKISLEGFQNETLNNRVEIAEQNNKRVDNFSFTQEQKEGLRAFARLYGVSRATALMVDKGYDQKLIQQILEGVENNSSFSEV